MEKQHIKNLLGLIIVTVMCLVSPTYVVAQKTCQPGHILICDANGKHCNCVKYNPCPRTGCGTYSGENAPVVDVTSTTVSQASSISFQLELAGQVSVKIYDVTGRLIRTLIDESVLQGLHELTWNGKDEQGCKVSPGIYVVKLEAEDYTDTEKISLVL
jgi:hypothetical protein